MAIERAVFSVERRRSSSDVALVLDDFLSMQLDFAFQFLHFIACQLLDLELQGVLLLEQGAVFGKNMIVTRLGAVKLDFGPVGEWLQGFFPKGVMRRKAKRAWFSLGQAGAAFGKIGDEALLLIDIPLEVQLFPGVVQCFNRSHQGFAQGCFFIDEAMQLLFVAIQFRQQFLVLAIDAAELLQVFLAVAELFDLSREQADEFAAPESMFGGHILPEVSFQLGKLGLGFFQGLLLPLGFAPPLAELFFQRGDAFLGPFLFGDQPAQLLAQVEDGGQVAAQSSQLLVFLEPLLQAAFGGFQLGDALGQLLTG